MRQESLRFDDLDFSHPILAGSTMAEIREAMDEIARKANDDLSATYAHWMGSSDMMSIGPDEATDWMTLTKLRYARFQHRNLINQRAAMMWSPADIWLVHYFPLIQTQYRTNYYAIQSVISKEPAQYFYHFEPFNARGGIVPKHHRVIIPETERRFPPRRTMSGVLNDVLGRSMESFSATPVLPSDQDFSLHNYIINTFR